MPDCPHAPRIRIFLNSQGISPTGQAVNHIVRRERSKSFKPFNRCAPFKSFKIGIAVPVVPIVSVGDEYVGCEWIRVAAQGVPAHIGTPSNITSRKSIV